MKKQNLLFVRNMRRSFIDQDIYILEKHFNVKIIDFMGDIKHFYWPIKTFFNLIKGMFWADVIFCWFADIHSYITLRFCKIFKKKAIVIIGGYEMAAIPESNYGLMLNKKSIQRLKYILENSNKILSVSKFIKEEILKFTPDVDVRLLYNAVDTERFKSMGKKENIVLTTCGIRKDTIKIKGLETFVKTAIHFPNIKFKIIGKDYDNSINYLKKIAPANVEFLGYIPWEKIVIEYQKSKVYSQLSYRESFGMALAEAMACECVPVVTNEGAIPELVGDVGLYVPYADEKLTAEAITKAFKVNETKKIRYRIEQFFSLEIREKQLIEIIYATLD